jgi:hypothetical protein
MGTVSSSLNPGVADLLKNLANVGSPVLQSSSVVSALEKAPTSDIVQLSMEASQLSSMDALFGIGSASTSTSTSPMMSLLQTLETPASNTSSTNATESPTEQASSAQAAAQLALMQGLFGTGINNSLPGSIFNTLG